MFKVNNKYTSEFTSFCSVTFVDFEQVNVSWVVQYLPLSFRLLRDRNLANKYMLKVNNRNTRKMVWNMFKVNNKDSRLTY